MSLVVRRQAGVKAIMIGDSDHIQVAALCDMLQNVAEAVNAIAGSGMDVQIGAPVQVRLSHTRFSLVIEQRKIPT